MQKKKIDKIDETKRLFTLHEAAHYIAVSYWTMRAYVIRGFLPYVQFPSSKGKKSQYRRWLIDKQDLDRFIETHRFDSHVIS